uniref:Gasdermin Eb n=1 Tax=Astyanax mexicanus TaxID=7994 RepID=A0A3B1KDK0_ASTMX
MFAKATSKFVTEIDPDGCLIPVSRLNESDNLTLTSSRYGARFTPIHEAPHGAVEFSEYNSTLENNTSGAAEAGFGPGNVNLSGKGSSKLASSFGNLKKQELDLQKVLDQTKDRVLDMQHSLIQQTQQKRTEVFALVKERIVTTQPCTVTEEVQEGGSCGAFFGLTVPKKISVRDTELAIIILNRCNLRRIGIEDLCCGKKPDLSTLDKTPSLKAAVKTTLELLQSSSPTSHSKSPQKRNSSEDPLNTNVFMTIFFKYLNLKNCLLDLNVQNVVGNKTCSLKDRSVSALAEEKTFSRVKALFDSSNITLCKEEDAVRAEIRSQQGHAPLILCIAIRGLACLATPA